MPKFTERYMATLATLPGKKDRLVFDSECPGLGVRVTVKGTRTFLIQRTDAAGRKVREALGLWGALTVEQARDAARVRLGAMARGIDIVAERREKRAAVAAAKAEVALTLDRLIEDWAALHLAKRRPRYQAEAERALRVGFASQLNKPAARLDRKIVVDTLDKMMKAGAVAMASRTLAYGRACFTWGQRRGKLDGNPFLGLPIAPAIPARERVLDDKEIAAIWRAAVALPEPWGPLLRMLMLTLARREEVAAMRWSELTPDLSTWTIPAERMKLGKPHIVALTDAAQEALSAVTRIEGQDLVFTTTGKTAVSGFSKVKIALDKASGVSEWRLHDFRRTGVSTLASLGFDPVVADKLLAHQPHALSAVARVYQRHDFAAERQAALKEWSKHVLNCTPDKAARDDNIIAFRRA